MSGWLADTARTVVSSVEDFLSDFSVADWVLIALAFAALYWVWTSLRSTTRLGPIEVELLEHDGDGELDVRALTATLRERLAASGLVPPPVVPSGTPQTNLVTAVKESPVPDAGWIASLLQLVPSAPEPARYKLSGTLLGEAPVEHPRTTQSAASPGNSCGLSFWLRPERDGAPLLDTVARRATHERAVLDAATTVYLHISRHAPQVFPPWARWHTPEGLEAFVEAGRARREGRWGEAHRKLRAAERLEPANVLVQLQLANTDERDAALVGGSAAAKKAERQAGALRRYLNVAVEWPQLVEARYRAAILAATLAATCSKEGVEHRRIAGILNLEKLAGLPAGAEGRKVLTDQLHRLAESESAAVEQLLRPWYTLLRERRLRNQFEPRADERKELRRIAAVSRHCLVMRRTVNQRRHGFWVTLGAWRREAAVHYYHLIVGRASVNWQTHYNAACFDGLLLAHLGTGIAAWRKRWIRGRLFRHLKRALGEAGDLLDHQWVLSGDLDLDSVRTAETDWQALKARLEGGAQALTPFPGRPWGGWLLRSAWWSLLGVGSFALLVAFLSGGIASPFEGIAVVALAVAIGVVVRRIYVIVREAGLALALPAAGAGAEEPSP
jgi:hypothetical protein